jgi:histidinol phosphatase-like PHP family hydrolase
MSSGESMRVGEAALPFCEAAALLRGIPLTDMHLHTTYTDGRMGVAEVLDQAKASGLREIGFTDHARRTSTYVPAYLEEIGREAARICPEIRVFRGLEVKITTLAGEIDLAESVAGSLDFVVGSLHRLPAEPDEEVFVSWNLIKPSRAVDVEVEATLAMMQRGRAQVVGHLGRVFLEHYNVPFPDSAIRAIVEGAKRHCVAIELNGRFPAEHFARVLRHCLDVNCLVAVSSDAHQADEVGLGVRMLRAALQDLSQ